MTEEFTFQGLKLTFQSSCTQTSLQTQNKMVLFSQLKDRQDCTVMPAGYVLLHSALHTAQDKTVFDNGNYIKSLYQVKKKKKSQQALTDLGS